MRPPTVEQLARDCWLGDVQLSVAVATLTSTQAAAFKVIYAALQCEENETQRRLSYDA